MPIVDPFDTPTAAAPRGIVDPFAADSAAAADKPLNWSDVPLEAVKNIPSDAYETGKGIVGGAVNVAKTVAPYARYGIGAPAAMATDAAKAIYNDPSILKKLPAAVWNNLVESYGSEEALKHTIANHPVKFAADLATVLSGGEAAISRGLGAVSDITKAADVSKPFFEGLPREAPLATPPPLPPAPGSREAVIGAANRLSQTGEPVEISRAAASDITPVQQMGMVTANVPYGGTPLVRTAGQTIEQLGTKADEAAKSYGSAAPVADAGEVASKSLTDWITGESKANADKAYKRAETEINPQTTTPLDNTLQAVSDIAAKQPASSLPAGKAVDMVLPAVQTPGGLTYEGIKNLRTNIGQMLSRGILPDDVNGGHLKQIYGALSDDLNASVGASGPKAQALFDRANKYYGLISDRREALAKIVGASGDTAPEKVFDRLTAMAGTGPRADINKLARARKVMGADDWNEVASSVVSRLGRDVEGNFSPQRFLTDYGNMSDAGRNLLFKSTNNPLKSHLDDIAEVSSRFKRLQQFANPSGTARGVAGASLFFQPLVTLKAVVGARVAASILSKPAQAASAAKWAQAKYALAASPSPARMAAYAMASRNLISTLGDQAQGITVPDFMRALQGPSPAGAQNEQR